MAVFIVINKMYILWMFNAAAADLYVKAAF